MKMFGVFLKMEPGKSCSPGGDLLAMFNDESDAISWKAECEAGAYVEEIDLRIFDRVTRRRVEVTL